MQVRGGGKFSVHHHVIGEAWPQQAHGPLHHSLARPVFTLPRAVGFDVERECQTGSHRTDHHQMMTVAGNLAGLVAMRPAEAATASLTSPHGGPIHRQADEGAVVKGLVTLGLVWRTSAKAARVGEAHRRSVK